jgi:gliding motility-associated-like protein
VTIIYKVCNGSVCATATVNVDVIAIDVVEVPKVVTPNGDGFNDVLEVKGISKYPNNSLIIFNRWGSEVFRAAPYNNDWDGRSTGKLTIGKGTDAKVPVGTYFYIMKLEGGKEISGYIYVAY